MTITKINQKLINSSKIFNQNNLIQKKTKINNNNHN